jgi:hypothetical protein
MPYEFVEDIAVADIAFRAWEKTSRQLSGQQPTLC